MNVKQTIEHLLGGVSKAPTWQRSKYHVTAQTNALASTVRGLCKRPPLKLYKTLSEVAAFSNAYFHTIDRGDGTLFRAVFPGDGTVQVYDEAGTAKTVTNNAGTTYLNPATKALRALTVGDRTYVLNPEIAVAEGTATLPDPAAALNEALVWVKGMGTTSDFFVLRLDWPAEDPTEFFTGAASGGAQPDAIADELKTDIETDDTTGKYVITRSGSLLHIKRADGTNFKLAHKDPEGGFLMPVFHGTQGSGTMQDLPTEHVPTGLVLPIAGDPTTDVDDFFVKWNGDNWDEIVKPGDGFAFDETTLPHELVYRPSTDDFVFQTITWEERSAGDSTTNPKPSIVGEKINELFHHQGRLGLISGNLLVLSRAGEQAALLRETVRAYRDNAPIDIESAMHGSTSFHSALSWNERLYLISPAGQFLLTGDPVVTPRTVGLEAVSSYPTTSVFRPEDSGDRVFLARRTDGGTQVSAWTHREQFPAQAVDLTQEVGNYVAGNPVALAADDSMGFLALATDDDASVLYILRYMMDDSGSPSLLNWGKWQFPVGVGVKDLEIVNGTLYVVFTLGTTTKIGSVGVREALTDKVPITFDLGTDSYTFTVDLSRIYMRDQQGRSETQGRLTLHYLDILFSHADNVAVQVYPGSRATRETFHTASGASTMRIPIRAKADGTLFTLYAEGTSDCAIAGLYWEGDYHDHYKPV